MRTRLVTEIDRLQELKIRHEFNHAAAYSGELLREGEVSVDNIQTLTADAQRLASDLCEFGATPPVAHCASSGAGYEKERFLSRVWRWAGSGYRKCTGRDTADLYRGSASNRTAIGRSDDAAAGPRRYAAVGRSDDAAIPTSRFDRATISPQHSADR